MYGAALAQVLQLLVSPIFSRVFDPTEIGILTVFMVLPNILIPSLGGRFELAMVLPRSDKYARILLGLAFKTSLAIFLVFFAITAVGFATGHFPDLEKLNSLTLLIPIYTFITGQVFILQFALNRSEQYKKIGETKLCIVIFTSILSITFGLLGWGSTGLILGAFFAQFITLLFLSTWVRKWIGIDLLTWHRRSSFFLYKYRTYPLLLAPSNLLDAITLALPVIVLNQFCGNNVVGWYGFMARIAVAPITLLSTSVRHVNLNIVAELFNNGKSARPHIFKVGAMLWGITLLPLAAIMIWGPDIVAFAFGEQWREGGVYLQILGPAYAARLVGTSLTMTIGAAGKNHLAVIWSITGFCSTLIVLLANAMNGAEAKTIILNYAICDFLVYVFLQVLIVYAAGRPKPNEFKGSDSL